MSWIKKIFALREQSDGDVVKPFLDHMEDLRWTVMKMFLAAVIGMFVAFFFRTDLMEVVLLPLDGIDKTLRNTLISLKVTEGFMISLKLSFYAGIVLSFPFLLYYAAEFVLPALTRKERKMLVPAIGGGFILFGSGVLACYYLILPQTLGWFYHYSRDTMKLNVTWQAGDYFSFVTHLTLACGLLCELPVAVLALSALGMVSYQLLSTTRPYAITLILILVAMISPTPDPFTFLALSAPVLLIYEACIWIVWLLERRKRAQEQSVLGS